MYSLHLFLIATHSEEHLAAPLCRGLYCYFPIHMASEELSHFIAKTKEEEPFPVTSQLLQGAHLYAAGAQSWSISLVKELSFSGCNSAQGDAAWKPVQDG